MSSAVFDTAIDWMTSSFPPDQQIDLTFHGGEPLLAGRPWFERSLSILRQCFGNRLKMNVQSNLWLLDDEYCQLFQEYDVSLGTSLDGPEAINDAQRGDGYFALTMGGIETARRHGLSVGAICTLTRLSALHDREIFDFFVAMKLPFSIHAAVSALGRDGDDLTLSPDEHAGLLVRLFDLYLENLSRIQISTFDAMAQSISADQGGLCTFDDCLGRYLTIGPQGGIFSCNRFAHYPEWQIGSVWDNPTLETLAQSPIWQRLRQRELSIHQECSDCPHFAHCKGGCTYNAIAASGRRDPHCPAYRRLFDHITDCALAEVFSEENMAAVVNEGIDRHGLLHKGKLLQIMRGGPHPQTAARRARETVVAVALAASDGPADALHRLDLAGAITHPDRALASLQTLRRRLDEQPGHGLLNIYLHVTYACNLRCTHCYAAWAGDKAFPAMAVDSVASLVRQAAEAGFRKAVITGGEPLMHPRCDDLLDALAGLRPAVKPMQIILRTNLAGALNLSLIERLACCADQIVVSMDGNEASHDARRGVGTYARTGENLRTLVHLAPGPFPAKRGEVVIAATLTAAQMTGIEGNAVRVLGRELGLPVRFKPVLPLGRAASSSLRPEFDSSLEDSVDALAHSAGVTATCGLGLNLYIGPGGECYPCYALAGERHALGNALAEGLAAALARNDAYRSITVDSNRRCRHCILRYLCGGLCRAWSGDDPDAPPADCTALYERAQRVLMGALETLDIPADRWRAAGLMPDATFEQDR